MPRSPTRPMRRERTPTSWANPRRHRLRDEPVAIFPCVGVHQINNLHPEKAITWSFSRDAINGLRCGISTRLSLQERQCVRLAGVVGGDELHRIDQLA